ncbi:MAG TPA: type VI secretion system tube protein Hcp [Planctomycetaceae bacterium]|nr:type VI secretion system tube protein Hcp [Planctomycetaceae bacterium]
MNSQVYLLLVRGTDALPKSAAAIGVALKALLLDMIRGDSLDVPYLNFIRVGSVAQSIGTIKEEYSYADASGLGIHDFTPGVTDTDSAGRSVLKYLQALDRLAPKPIPPPPPSAFGVPSNVGGLSTHLPTQGTITFNKLLDGATPQLAFGCSTQEPFRFALFYFQRKVGFNLGSVVFPHLVLGLQRVMIRKWEMADDTEKVTLAYQKICWGAYNPWADAPIPQSVSTRYWDCVNNTGGYGLTEPFCLFTLGITTALFLVGAAAASAGAMAPT